MTVAVSFSNQMDNVSRLYAARISRTSNHGFLRPNQLLYKDKVLRLTRFVTRGFLTAQDAVFSQFSEIVAKRLGGKVESYSPEKREVVVVGDTEKMGQKLQKLHPCRLGGWLYTIPIDDTNRHNWCTTMRHELYSASLEPQSSAEPFTLKEMLKAGDIRVVMKNADETKKMIITHTWYVE